MGGFSFALCIPTRNPGALVEAMVAGIRCQTLQPVRLLVVDSSPSDGEVDRFGELGADIVRIDPMSFDHGGARNRAFALTGADGHLFLTQDAIPAGQSRVLVALTVSRRRGGPCAAPPGRGDAR